MRIFHAAVTLSNEAYKDDVFVCFVHDFVIRQGDNIKTITIFCDWRYNRGQLRFLNQKGIANEKHQPNADRCVAGTTETLR